MNRTFICLVVSALMLLVITGCSSDNSRQAAQDAKSTAPQAQEANPSPVSVKNQDGSVTVESGTGSVSVSTDKSVELPKGYPADKFPMYEGSFIYTALEQSGTYAITAYSKDDVKKVIAFYNKVLEGAKVNMDTKTDESLTSMGTKSGYAYTLDVGKSPEQGYQTIITISLQPAE